VLAFLGGVLVFIKFFARPNIVARRNIQAGGIFLKKNRKPNHAQNSKPAGSRSA
jgi:hypothetical protein